MSDSLEPPAKRARLEADAPMHGASAPALDAPGSPVDDLDDDFYDNSPVKPSALPAVQGPPSLFAAAAPAPVGFHLPGLGSASEARVTHTALHVGVTAHEDEAPEEGELSDDDAFYNDASAVALPVAGQEQALGDALLHGKMSRLALPAVYTSLTFAQDAAQDAAADTPSADTDGELDAALTAAIELQNQQSHTEDAAAAAALASDAAIIDSKLEFLRAAEANRENKDAEWQLDSDASDSASSSDSSTSDSDSEGGSDDGELLDPEEQVRLLLEEALEEEPGATGKAKVKTLNEVEEQYEKPDITVTEQTKITELGNVESVVENLVLIKAKTSGDYEVLESGSALCLQNRIVIGKVSEQMGRVEEPRYALGFNDAAEITALGIQKDTPVYYVNDHSTFVLTEPLRYQKHTDASNLHDEETNDVEFSDDEKEAEYKREQKAKKRARTDGNEEPAPTISLPIPTGPRAHVDAPMAYRSMEYQGGGLKYSDDEDEDLGMYKPLARPDHFEQIVGHGAPLEDRSHVRRGMGRGRGPWGDRGRGFRGRGGFSGRGDFSAGQGNRGGFGGGRGDFGGGRGDRGGHGNRGDRGGNNNRGDRGGRGTKSQADRGGRQQDQFQNRQQNQQKNGPQHDGRSAASASPARQQQDRQRSQSHQGREQSQSQQSPATGGKNKNRKQRQREKRERERLQQQQQQGQGQGQQQQGHQQQGQQQQGQQQHASPAPSAPSNVNAYANNSNAAWSAPYSTPAQPAANFAHATLPPQPAAAASYPYAAFAPQAQAPAQQQAQQAQQGGQANVAAWAQWLQLAAAVAQQQQPVHAPAPPPPPPPPVPQHHHQPPAPQYHYPYQQYGQPAPPPVNPPQQGSAQSGGQSLQDILRALGGGGAPQ
ncbi:NAF1-domain-containing protein [Plenodomus tracheiphilus IPT5]|uniref:H/ACA ribonucleoprotein complex non-core subunit NAF1 n=1 Tax=Plenodomus tracheiphilus IPT5 TaxID=1408161 RepID=A0A6A7AZE0_9PLEO|nr:NAF1-domain-containing protein [Plenodomus tracheiphilus IPT5]